MKMKKKLNNLQNMKNHQEPPKELVKLIIDTFSNGKITEAIIEIELLIKQYPLAPLLFNVSGSFYKSNSQLDVAVTKFKQALTLKPNYTEVHYNLGVTLRELGHINEAIKSYKNALSIKNEHPDAHYNLGNALLSLKQYDDAIEHFKSAIVFNPKFAQAYNNLGILYKQLGKDLEAGKNFDKALAIKPDYAEAANDRGVIYQNSGDHESAIKYYQKSLEINPNLADAYNNIGLAEKELNNTDNAIKSFEKALSINPNLANSYYNLSRFKQYTISNEQVAKMQSLLSTVGVSQSDLIKINFALAGVNEYLGNQDELFKVLHEGNRLRKEELNYSLDQDLNAHLNLRSLFKITPSTPEKLVSYEPSKIRPIFIVGMPRSGTTLVEQIISSHHQIHGAGELNTLNKLITPIVSNFSIKDTNISEKVFLSIRKVYLDFLSSLNTPESIITDKMPMNFRYIGFILKAFPEAKIVHLKRDSRAVCWSIYKRYFPAKGLGFAFNMEDLSGYYNSYTELMFFWHQFFPEKIYDICYEDLTTNQEEETKKLLEYCELDWDDNCLNFHKNKRAVKTASSLQVREKMYQGSSDAWKKYEAHIHPLINGLKPYLKQ